MKKMWCCILWFFFLLLPMYAHAFDKVFIQGYYGRVADMSLQNFFESPGRITDFEDANMLTLGCGGENFFWKDRFSLGGGNQRLLSLGVRPPRVRRSIWSTLSAVVCISLADENSSINFRRRWSFLCD